MNTGNEIEISSNSDEMMVLGTILNNQENGEIGLKKLKEEDFYSHNHKTIFKAIKDVFNEKGIFDIYLISQKLKEKDHLERIGGLPYLINLPQYAGTSGHIEAYCDDLRKLTTKRQLISALNALSIDLKQGMSVEKIIDQLKVKIGNIEKHTSYAESAFRYLLDTYSEDDLKKEIRNISPGISIGYYIGDIDIKIPGGAITIVAGPTSHGKTATLINFALGALNRHPDKKVYFFTYEESSSSILLLFLNTYINKELSKNNRESIKSYFYDQKLDFIKNEKRILFEKDKQDFFSTYIDNGRLQVVYSDLSAEELVNAIRFLAKNTNVGLICIDYMQLLRMLRGPHSRQEELKQICLILKDCAIETGLPILLAAQFNRSVVAEADLSPTNIGEAGDIERVASMIIGFWNRSFEGFSREGNIDKKKKAIAKEPAIYFEILKGRGIGCGHSCIMDFDGNTGKISNRCSNKNFKEEKSAYFG